jgi:cell division transport system permease protein
MLDRIEFLLSEAFIALRRNGLMTFAAVTTAAAALFLLGGLAYVYYRVSGYTENVSGKFEMNVFMRLDLPRPQALDAADKIRQMPGVRSVTLVPKEQAWQEWQKKLSLSSGGIDNPLPDALHVMLTDPKKADGLASQIELMPEVIRPGGVSYSKDVQQLMDTMLSLVRLVGGVFGFLLFITAGILIHNAIRLTVIARRREIRIMQLVGASYATIWIPFVIEGMIQGAVGGFIAAFLLWGAQVGFMHFLEGFSTTVSFPIFPLWTIAGLLAAAGAGYGILCSAFAIREPLRHVIGALR